MADAIRVLIVDDSAVMRTLLQRKLELEGGIEVVATAAEVKEARALIKQHDPDVVTLDIEMPGMDGLSFLAKIMELRPTPVIIVSGATEKGAAATAKALQLGAVDCYAKSELRQSLDHDDGGKLGRMVRNAAKVRMPQPKPRPSPARHKTSAISGRAATKPPTGAAPGAGSPSVIAIGSSTGGVEALHSLLAGFPRDCPPTLIVQHINACFAPAIAQSLDKSAAPQVVIAEADMPAKRGQIMLAPGGETHLQLAGSEATGFRCALRPGDPVSGHRPSVDALFASMADVAGDMALGILLTGMGRDGAEGLHKMALNGASTIAQDEESCVVFGMPRAAIALGAAREVLSLDAIAAHVFSSRKVPA